jgi:hypothetical protein
MEVSPQTQGSLRSDPAALMHNFPYARRRNMQFERELVDCQAKRLHEILTEDFTGMHRRHKRFGLVHLQLLASDS